MKLIHVYQARSAWQKLSNLSMRPQFAYKILSYVRKIEAEAEIIEQQRIAILRRVSGVTEGDICIEQGTEQFTQFIKEFDEVLFTESDLEKFNKKLSEVIGAISDNKEGLMVADLAVLEPFFQEEDDE